MSTVKKSGSMPKGAVPPQLKKPRAWVEFTLKDALENGWETFIVMYKKKDKDTNIVTEEQIEMPCSILKDGSYIYEDSVNDKNPEGRQIIHKDAMSLSKQRKETNHESYSVFEAQYIDDKLDDSDSDTGSETSKRIVIKKTQAEKEDEIIRLGLQKKADKEALSLQKKTDKEALSLQKKIEKDALVLQKKTEKDALALQKKTVVKTTVKSSVIQSNTTSQLIKVEEVPNDGMVHPWTYKGKRYFRNFDGETWIVGSDGGVGKWIGIYDVESDKMDTSAPEPVFDDDE